MLGNTFSKLRHRVAANMPGLVRTKSESYGRQDNTDREQAQCDEGTILACRAIDMAVAVAERKQVHRVPPVATLENPPQVTALSTYRLGNSQRWTSSCRKTRGFMQGSTLAGMIQVWNWGRDILNPSNSRAHYWVCPNCPRQSIRRSFAGSTPSWQCPN